MQNDKILNKAVSLLWDNAKTLIEYKKLAFINSNIVENCVEINMSVEDANTFMNYQEIVFIDDNIEVICLNDDEDSLVSIYFLDNEKEVKKRSRVSIPRGQ